MSLRVVFMGTPEFSVPVLRAVHERSQVVGVYTQPDQPRGRGQQMTFSPIKQAALDLNLRVFQPDSLKPEEEVTRLKELAPDLLIVVAYGQILRQNVLDLPKLFPLNIHASLLPRWRGASPIQAAILAGDTVTGVTVQKMVLKLDAGDCYVQKALALTGKETSQTLFSTLSELSVVAIQEAFDKIMRQDFIFTPQDAAAVTLSKKFSKNDEKLNPYQKSAVELEREIRAFAPWPGSSIWVGGERIKLGATELTRGIHIEPGRLVERAGGLFLGTIKGALEITRLQREGKKMTVAADFLNALRGKGEACDFKIAPVSEGI